MVESATSAGTIHSRSGALRAAQAAEAKKGHDTIVLDVRAVTLLADYFVIVGGETATQVRAIAEAIDAGMAKIGYTSSAVEGKREARWVLIDYGDVIVHVLRQEERRYYKLEQFWNQALIVDRGEWVAGGNEEKAGYLDSRRR